VERDEGGSAALEARFGYLIEHLREIVFLVDLDGNWTFLNPAWTTTLGFPVDESIGRPYHEHIHPDDRAASLARLDALVREEREHCEAVFRMYDRAGDVHWIEIAAWIYRDGDVMTALAGTLQDVTEQVVAARELERERDRLVNVIDGTRVGIWETDEIARVGYYSAEWAEMLGYERHELGTSLDDFIALVHPDDEPQRDAAAGRMARREVDFLESTFRMRHKDGHWVWIRSRGRVVEWAPDGRPARTAGTHTDVTEQVKAEQALRSAQKMEALGRVAGGIAHDFNNLLSVIIGSTDLLDAARGGDAAITQPSAAIRAAAERATALTRRLLEVSQQRGVAAERIDLNAAVRGADLLLSRALTPAIPVEYDLAPGALAVEVDPGLLADVLLNLAINARDAMPDGGSLRIHTHADEQFVTLSVADSGVGMPAEVQARVFDPFFTTKDHGTGLGLSLAYAFARQSDGSIDVASAPGAGTTFTFRFPRATAAATHDPVAKPVSLLRGRGEVVLVVDDEGMLRELARLQLEGAGYKVLTAADADAALGLLATEPGVRLVFSDVVMPGGTNGFGLAQVIAERHPDVRVLLTTGYAGEPDRAGYSGPVLAKPYTRSDLIDAVRAVLA